MQEILVVEDEAELRSLFARGLEREGYTVHQAENGLAGLEHVRNRRPDLIVSDIKMPKMDGHEFYKRLRDERGELAEIPFIFLTAFGGDNQIIDGIRMGVDGYLTKPVKMELLVATIGSVLGHRRKQLDRLKQKLQSTFSSVFDDNQLSVGQYENIDALLAYCSELWKSGVPSKLTALTQDITLQATTLDDAKRISGFLCGMCPEPESAMIGILELIVNGIEHGNLGVGYELKTKLLQEGTWHEEIERRLNRLENKDKYVSVRAVRLNDRIELTITDRGPGFESGLYREYDPMRSTDLHGRGITLAATVSFDSLEFRESGSQAVACIRLTTPPVQ